MKKEKENGRGMIKALIFLVAILFIIGLIIKSLNTNFNEQKADNIMSDMLLIQGACKVLNENKLRTKSEEELVGTKMSSIQIIESNQEENIQEETDKDEGEEGTQSEDNSEQNINSNIMYDTIEEFKKIQVISEEEYEKYYILTDEDLEKLKVDVKNEKNAYYLINYDSNEVILTKGYEGKYKLSDMEKTEKDENVDIEVENASENGEEEKKE